MTVAGGGVRHRHGHGLWIPRGRNRALHGGGDGGAAGHVANNDVEDGTVKTDGGSDGGWVCGLAAR